MAALVAADRDALHVFLQRRGDDLVDRAVVPEVDDLGAHALQDAPHDVDGRVVAVEQAGRGDEAHLVRGAVAGEGLEFGGEVGHGAVSRRKAGRRLIDVYVNVNRPSCHRRLTPACSARARRSWFTRRSSAGGPRLIPARPTPSRHRTA
jgi:hypothetical protein